MNDFEFEQSPWETFLESQRHGSHISALLFLSLLEDENDDAVEEAFQDLTYRGLGLDISTLPVFRASGNTAVRLKEEADFVKNGFRIRALSETDPLRLYLEEIASIPAFGDENVLASELSSSKKGVAEALTNLGLSHVVTIAGEYAGCGVLLLDLIQEGSIGLWQAIQTFDSGDYPSYRDSMIRSAMNRAVVLQARSNGIGQKMRDAMQDYKSADEKLLMELGRNPSLEEIASEIHMSPEETAAVQKMMENAMFLDRAESDSALKGEESEEELAVEDTAFFQMRQRISDLLSILDDRDAQVLTLRFGLEKVLPMSPEDTAREMRIPVSEVISREASALAKLRENK